MLQQVQCHIRGIVPVIVHNDQAADPFNEFCVAIKNVSGKRKKTDADHLELARLEFLASMYVDQDGEPCIPGENIEAMIIAAISKSKSANKKDASSALMSFGNFKLIYNGPKNPEELWGNKKFVDRRAVVVQRARILRTRPIFTEWELKFSIDYEDSVLNRDTVISALGTAGRMIGLCDYRPKFGRFEVLSVV